MAAQNDRVTALLRARCGRSWVGFAMTWFVIVFAFASASGCSSGNVDRVTVEIKGESFTLDVANTPEKMHQGLSDVESIPDDGGMLFVYERPRWAAMVMRRCLVPIDVIFLNAGGYVINTHAMQVEPYDTPDSELRKYESGGEASFAIELRGGRVAELGVRRGDRIELPTDDLKAPSQSVDG